MIAGKIKKFLFSGLIALGLSSSAYAHNIHNLPPSIREYIKNLSVHYHFNEGELATLFLQSHFNLDVVRHISHPSEKKPWFKYRSIFLNPQRVAEGVAFWKQHQRELQIAEHRYGVPAQIIIAIIGVETQYGKITGNFSTMDALTTLSFYYPARAQFFRQELTEFLLLTRERKISPLSMRGSYAGALGIPQFMPSSYRKYAVVNSHEAGSNLLNHPGDAILSIANYLNHMGWQAGKPVAETLTARKVPAYLVSTSAQPQYSIKKLRALGISLPGSKESREKAAIIQLAGNPGSANYWLTFANFHSIMRYNPRINYAMAVYQLSEAIKNGYESRRTNRTSIHFASRGKTR